VSEFSPPRVPLVLRPTPLHRLNRAAEDLGLDLWIKRDDLSGFAGGGNKGRKLEYLLGQALAEGAEVLVTYGAAQSNFVRQLGAACSVCGLSAAAAVMDLPYNTPADRPDVPALDGSTGNILLDRILGVDVRRYPDATWDDLEARAEDLAAEYERKGRKVMRVPVGGSSPLGAFAFRAAAQEIVQQAEPFDWIVFASSSGSTHTGLAFGLAGTRTKVMGIGCDPEPDLVDDFVQLAAKLAELIGGDRTLSAEEFLFTTEFVGPGYGVPSPEGLEEIRYLARREGILLDPVYTSKAFAGLRALAARGEVQGRVLFWHTGGVPALFAVPESYGLGNP
jgi:D-cysteine desulfhydrase family pyridoxal phosphate-dependent enzyme